MDVMAHARWMWWHMLGVEFWLCTTSSGLTSAVEWYKSHTHISFRSQVIQNLIQYVPTQCKYNYNLCVIYTCTHDLAHQNETAELEDLRELGTYGVLQVFGFHLSHLATGEVKHLLTAEWSGCENLTAHLEHFLCQDITYICHIPLIKATNFYKYLKIFCDGFNTLNFEFFGN